MISLDGESPSRENGIPVLMIKEFDFQIQMNSRATVINAQDMHLNVFFLE